MIEGKVALRLPGTDVNGLPGTLLSIPLDVEITQFEPPVVDAMAEPAQEEAEDTGFGALHVVLIMLAVAVIPTCFVLLHKRRTRRHSYKYKRIKRYHRTLLH